MNYNKIPLELKNLNQWCIADENKVPISIENGSPVDICNRQNYKTFDEVANTVATHIGFILTEDDPYTVIDLDAPLNQEDIERQKQIIEAFDSYTERSQSGNGFHIFIKGVIPVGARRDRVEIYSSKRYMITTGDVVLDRPIVDKQELLNSLYADMKKDKKTIIVNENNSNFVLSDAKIVDIASSSVNGAKFISLCKGEWQGKYPSQSEADAALLSILCFYSQDNEQVKRIFHYTELGKREKAHRPDYLNRVIGSIRGSGIGGGVITNIIPTNDNIEIKNEIEEVKETTLINDDSIFKNIPDGLLKDLTDYIFKSSIRPVYEISLAASLTFFSGIIGRAYNISHSGLNQYTLLIAETGTGKEGASSGIDRIINALSKKIPSIFNYVGPAGFASGPALIKVLNKKNCFYSILGEFGHVLINMSNGKANSASLSLKQVLLDLYQKSGKGSVLKSTVYSDSEKNTAEINNPAVTILGETTPGILYDNITEEVIEDGLLPRFNIINYTGKRPARNKTAFSPPPEQLLNNISDLVVNAISINNNNVCHEVAIQEEALTLFDEFDELCDNEINTNNQEFIKHLWNRAHLKALKLAGVCAVTNNFYNPVVTPTIAQWAINFSKSNIEKIMEFFRKGVIGSEQSKKELLVKKWINDYLILNEMKRTGYNVKKEIASIPYLIPYSYIRQKAKMNSKFFGKSDYYITMLDNILKSLQDGDLISELDKINCQETYKTNGRLFVVNLERWKNEKL